MLRDATRNKYPLAVPILMELPDVPILSELREERSSRISRPPGSRLLAAAEFCCSPKTYRLFQSVVVDFQLEYCETLGQGRTRKLWMVRIRGYWSFWRTALALFPVSLARLAVRLWSATGGGLPRST